ncbi:MAG: hypothetical protein GY896_11460 [Gammaproteobacteria bacterium]|nr:hypothetical protein [Gammaproteobacteria bacterium]
MTGIKKGASAPFFIPVIPEVALATIRDLAPSQRNQAKGESPFFYTCHPGSCASNYPGSRKLIIRITDSFFIGFEGVRAEGLTPRIYIWEANV